MKVGFAAAVAPIVVALVLVACAPKADRVAATYASPEIYAGMTCQELASEGMRVSNAAHSAAGLENRHRTQDTVATTVGIVIFWPALFFNHGSDATTSQLAELKGQMEAIEAASATKKCGINFTHA